MPERSDEDGLSPLAKMRGGRNNHEEKRNKRQAGPASAAPSVATVGGLAEGLKSLLRQCDFLVCMCSFGAVCILASVVFGFALQRNVGEEIVGDFTDVRTIPVDIAAYAIEPWNTRNCNMVLGDELLVIFVLRRYVFAWMATRFFSHLPEAKRAKIANYMLELLIMNVTIGIAIWCGFFQLLVNPSSFHHPTAVQGDRLFIGAQQTVNLFIATYVIEMSFDHKVRKGLVMHHWAVFLLCVWGTAALYTMGYDVLMTRTFFCLSLYISTEQNVFVEMLLYQRRIYMPWMFLLSAWYYLLTRLFIATYCILCWVDMFENVFLSDVHNSWVAYSMWAAIPFINLILNTTQMTTVISLFGIAKEVRKRCAEKPAVEEASSAKHQPRKSPRVPEIPMKKERSTSSTGSSVSTRPSSRLAPVDELELPMVACGSGRCLFEVFAEVDVNQRGTIMVPDWMQYVANNWIADSSVPLHTYEDIFDDMRDLCGRGAGVTVDAFVSYFDQYLLEDTDFDLVLSALALQKAHAMAEGDATLRTVLAKKHTTMMQRLLRQHRERRPSFNSDAMTAAVSDGSLCLSGGIDGCLADVLESGIQENGFGSNFEESSIFGPLRKLSLDAAQRLPARRRAKRTSKTWMGPATLPLDLAE